MKYICLYCDAIHDEPNAVCCGEAGHVVPMEDEPASKFEIVQYRVEYVFELGWIGDSEGRTWSNKLKEQHIFPTMEEAKAAQLAHPEVVKSPHAEGRLETTYPYGLTRVYRREVRI